MFLKSAIRGFHDSEKKRSFAARFAALTSVRYKSQSEYTLTKALTRTKTKTLNPAQCLPHIHLSEHIFAGRKEPKASTPTPGLRVQVLERVYGALDDISLSLPIIRNVTIIPIV